MHSRIFLHTFRFQTLLFDTVVVRDIGTFLFNMCNMNAFFFQKLVIASSFLRYWYTMNIVRSFKRIILYIEAQNRKGC